MSAIKYLHFLLGCKEIMGIKDVIFKLILLALGVFFTLNSYSQNQLCSSELLTTDNGLANLMVHAIHKDQEGFMWISTNFGLSRYDGNAFRYFTKENNDLQDNGLIAIISEEENGNLWLYNVVHSIEYENYVSISGIDVFDPNTERAVPFEAYIKKSAPFKLEELSHIKIIDPKNRPWFVTRTGQIYLFQNGEFTKIFDNNGKAVTHMMVDLQDHIWIGKDKEVKQIDLLGETIETIDLPFPIYGMWSGYDGDLWLTTNSGKFINRNINFWHKSKESQTIKPFYFPENNHLLNTTGFMFIHRTQSGYWYLVNNDHFSLFDEKGKKISDFNALLEGIPNPEILCHLEDDGLLWSGSPIGIIKTQIKENPFSSLQNKNGTADSRGITEDESGQIYFLNGEMKHWNPKTSEYKTLSLHKGAHGLLYFDSTLWCGYYQQLHLGFQYDLKAGKEKDYRNLRVEAPFYSYLETKKSPGTFLVGQSRGLAYLDLENKSYQLFEDYNDFEILKESIIYYLHNNKNGIWLATNNGVFLMNEEDGIVKHFNKADGNLLFDNVRHIHEDRDGIFWLATKGGGILKWIPGDLDKSKKSTCIQYTTKNGLSHDYTYAILEDDFENLWVSSDKGLMRINKKSMEIRSFFTQDGLPHNEFNLTSYHKAKSGIMYFGGLGGIIYFDPEVFAKEPQNQIPLKFTSYLILEDDAEEMIDKTTLLDKSDDLLIKPSDKLFELKFILLDYQNPEDHHYAYMIEGYSNHWVHTEDNYIRITNLPYGDYTLKIKGRSGNNSWSSKELSLNISMLKPYYLTGWFLSLVILSTAILSFLLIWWREKIYKTNRLFLEEEVKRRTWQIDEDNQIIKAQAEALKKMDKSKSQFFANITHEFRTPLSLIIGPVVKMMSKTSRKQDRERMKGVLKNAQTLLLLINQLLDISKLEEGKMSTDLTHGDVIEYTTELVNSFIPLASEKNFSLILDNELESWEINFDRSKWSKIVNNLLSNAIKFTPHDGSIHVRLSKVENDENDFIKLVVQDNGIGISKDNLDQIFNRFYQIDSSSTRDAGGTGIGLSLVKEIVVLQGGDIQVQSEIEKGTTFTVLMPVLEKSDATALQNELYSGTNTLLENEILDVNIELPETLVSTTERLQLLIVDDNQEMLDFIRECVEEYNYEVIEANNGEVGIQKALEHIPDLIICDVMMPKKNGFEVTKVIRTNKNTSHIPVILLTAKNGLDNRLEGLESGADVYLTKPFSPKELLIRIRKLLEIRSLLQERFQQDTTDLPKIKNYEKEDKFIVELKEYVLENIDENNLNGDLLGRNVGMSRVHLHRKLKALTNQNTSEFIRSIRLQKAIEMIEDGKLNISEISDKTGFSSVSNFSRTFKKAYGKAPSQM